MTAPAARELDLADPSCRRGHDWTRVPVVSLGDSKFMFVRWDQKVEICRRCSLIVVSKPRAAHDHVEREAAAGRAP